MISRISSSEAPPQKAQVPRAWMEAVLAAWEVEWEIVRLRGVEAASQIWSEGEVMRVIAMAVVKC